MIHREKDHKDEESKFEYDENDLHHQSEKGDQPDFDMKDISKIDEQDGHRSSFLSDIKIN